jgi:hypothetical protein
LAADTGILKRTDRIGANLLHPFRGKTVEILPECFDQLFFLFIISADPDGRINGYLPDEIFRPLQFGSNLVKVHLDPVFQLIDLVAMDNQLILKMLHLPGHLVPSVIAGDLFEPFLQKTELELIKLQPAQAGLVRELQMFDTCLFHPASLVPCLMGKNDRPHFGR